MQAAPSVASAIFASSIDMHRLLALANEQFGVAVDCDLRGTPITQLDTLIRGAYGPAVARAMNAVAARGQVAISRTEFEDLACAAFGMATDRYFDGSVITSYKMLLGDDGFGPEVYRLACLVAEDPTRVLRPAAGDAQ